MSGFTDWIEEAGYGSHNEISITYEFSQDELEDLYLRYIEEQEDD